MTGPTVVILRDTSLNDVPGMLRKTADDIEDGKYGAATGAVLVLQIGESEDLEIFSFGKMPTTAHVVGLMEAAKVRIIR